MMTLDTYLDTIRNEHTITQPRVGNQHIRFDNGWSVSVGYLPFHYCDNRFGNDTDPRIDWNEADDAMLRQTKTVEIAIFQPNGAFFVPHPDSQERCDGATQVWGWIKMDELEAVRQAVSALPATAEPAFCPCPFCVSPITREVTA